MKLKVWDSEKEKFLSVEEIEKVMGKKPLLKHDYFGIELNLPFVVVLYSGYEDNTKWDELADDLQKDWLGSGKKKEDWKGFELYDGDLIKNKNGHIWLINHDKKNAKFEQRRVGVPDEVFEMRHNTKTYIGNKFRNPDLLQ